MNISNLTLIQQQLSQQLIIPTYPQGFIPQSKHILFTFDIQYTEQHAFVAVDVREFRGKSIGVYVGYTNIAAEYVPQFFSFREGPSLLAMFDYLTNVEGIFADFLLVDGHGVAHPRRFGAASWLGIKTQLPTIGCAKRSLLRYEGQAAVTRGSIHPIYDRNECVGNVLRSQTEVKPIFVSVGNLISLEAATQAVLSLASPYRIPEPVRSADQNARIYAKGESNPPTIFVGKLPLA